MEIIIIINKEEWEIVKMEIINTHLNICGGIETIIILINFTNKILLIIDIYQKHNIKEIYLQSNKENMVTI